MEQKEKLGRMYENDSIKYLEEAGRIFLEARTPAEIVEATNSYDLAKSYKECAEKLGINNYSITESMIPRLMERAEKRIKSRIVEIVKREFKERISEYTKERVS